MRIYLDSSALIKRAIAENESATLDDVLARYARQGDVLVSSTLAWIEVTRALRSRLDAASPFAIADAVDRAMSGIAECPISEQVAGIARRIGPGSLRSLDAIHLASATLVDADVVCAYDGRMILSAQELGFATLSPGRADAGG